MAEKLVGTVLVDTLFDRRATAEFCGGLREGNTSTIVLNMASFARVGSLKSLGKGTVTVSPWDLMDKSERALLNTAPIQEIEGMLSEAEIGFPRAFCFPEWQYRQRVETFPQLFRRAAALNLVAARFLTATKPDLVVQHVGAEILRLSVRHQAERAGTLHLWLADTPFAGMTALDLGTYGDWWNPSVGTEEAATSVRAPRGTLPLGVSAAHAYAAASEAARFTRRMARKTAPLDQKPYATTRSFVARRIRSRTQSRLFVGERELKEVSNHSSLVFFPLHDNFDSQITLVAPAYFDQSALAQFIQIALPAGTSLVVKPHPAAMGGTATSEFANLAALGVKIVDPSVTVDRIFPYIQSCIVINSTVGFDALMAGVPVVALGKSFYSRRGWTIDCDSPAQAVAETVKLLAGEGIPEVDADAVKAELSRYLVAGRYSGDARTLGRNVARIASAL